MKALTYKRRLRSDICHFEGSQKFRAAVGFHIVVIHRQKLQELFSVSDRGRKLFRKLLFRKRLVLFKDRGQFLVPANIFPLEKRQEDLFFRLVVVIDRRSGKICRFFAIN